MIQVLIWQSSEMRILAVAEKMDYEILGLCHIAFLLMRFGSDRWFRR